ncbi:MULTISPECIES: hypothetical protein [unclassified Methylobacterium]|jgi:hypothetical protein|uniref:hypothetical protein n=1 Tax=unclassified Methylobacterium TaxID=2615210 RepID=UPI00135597F3|nr:hypothetical protein [Methylobacterium sp. 2A]MWV21529.1 hypothetical protein [Methylobacterium sp. 2A]
MIRRFVTIASLAVPLLAAPPVLAKEVPAKPPAAAEAPAAAPNAPAAKELTPGQTAARTRQKTCGAEWRALTDAQKAAQGPKWPQYWSKCNKRLKGGDKA